MLDDETLNRLAADALAREHQHQAVDDAETYLGVRQEPSPLTDADYARSHDLLRTFMQDPDYQEILWRMAATSEAARNSIRIMWALDFQARINADNKRL